MAALSIGWFATRTQSPPIYDPSRDAAGDIAQALVQARGAGKLVLIEVGGDLCRWSVGLERLFESDPGLARMRDERYVTVKVYAGPLKDNREVLCRYPEITAFPHLLVLDSDGRVLRSKDIEEYEIGYSYDPKRLGDFL